MSAHILNSKIVGMAESNCLVDVKEGVNRLNELCGRLSSTCFSLAIQAGKVQYGWWAWQREIVWWASTRGFGAHCGQEQLVAGVEVFRMQQKLIESLPSAFSYLPGLVGKIVGMAERNCLVGFKEGVRCPPWAKNNSWFA